MATGALFDAVVGAVNIYQVKDTSYDPGLTVAQHHYSGGVSPQQSDIVSGDPVVSITSGDIVTILDGIDATAGLAVSAGTVTVPIKNRSAGGLFASGSNHHTLSATHGLLIPVSISASQDEEDGAQIQLEFHAASSSGLANPITHNASQAAGSQTFTAVHDLGPAKVNGTTIVGIKSITVNFGINVNKQRYSGYPFCQLAGMTINEAIPSIEFEFEDIASLHAFATFTALSTTCVVYFRKRMSGGLRVAEATEEHVAFTLTNGIYTLESAKGSGRDNYTNSAKVYGHTLAYDTTSAIT